MFGIGFTEIMIVLLVALVFVGPEKLPELMKTLGRSYGNLRKSFAGIADDLTEAKDTVADGNTDDSAPEKVFKDKKDNDESRG
jgi:sec-independent protein translocase protein TatB